VEKIKLEKDGTSAFVDVYEYARKIRQGEMTWEEVEKADLDTVRHHCPLLEYLLGINCRRFLNLICFSHSSFCAEVEMGRNATQRQEDARSIHDAPTSAQWHCHFGSASILRGL
jgi:hypothetical protein